MLKAASTKIKAANLIAAAIASNHFDHSHHSLSLSYTSIIHILSVFARKKKRKNSLRKISPVSIWQLVWHEICSACHFGSFCPISAILAVSLAIAHLANRPVRLVHPYLRG
jgi:hypothetical protein